MKKPNRRISRHRVLRRLAAAFVLLVLSRGAWAQFVPAPNPPLPFPFPVGVGPVSIVAGNLNSDNVPDLAVLNQVDGTVTFILSNPPYGYTAAGPFNVGPNPGSLLPSAMAMGDFNNDGNQDLAITNAAGNTVSILLGDGKGGIKATLGPFPVGKTPDSIVVGAFNGDSNLDLAVANRDSNNVTILRGDGTGNFTAYPGSPFAVGNSPSSVAVGDFNGDGYLDLAITNELDNTVTVLLGSAAGAFQATIDSPMLVGYNPSFVTVSDFNLDGNLDLAVANLTSNTVTVLLGNGTGAFTPSPSGLFNTGSAPVFIAVADFNGDYIPDLAIANSGSSSNSVTVLLGNGTGGFKPCPGSPFAAGSDPRAIAVGDFNGDGPPDLAIADDGSDTVALLINTFTSTPVMLSGASFSPTAPVAPLSLVTIFGTALGPISTTGDPTQSGTTATLKDFSGAKNSLTLTYVMPTQINALVPASVATGAATFTINTATGGLQSGSITVASVAPSLFSANRSGKGVASGIFLPDLLADNPMLTFSCPVTPSLTMPCTSVGLDVSGGNSVLVLFGTGVRNRAKLSDVTVTVNGQSFPAFFAGASALGPGVDEVQVALPATLAGSGIVYVTVSDAGAVSNQVTIDIL